MTTDSDVPVSNLSAGVQSFTSNAFLVEGKRTVLVDAGANYDIVPGLQRQTEGLDALVLTHTHPDHIGNVDAVCDAFGVETWGFDTESGFVDHGIADGDNIQIGDHDYEALHTPGHKNDHLFFYAPNAGVAFAGDLVFAGGGFGRTDLEEGDRPTLIESIQYVLDTVDDNLDIVYTGHGAPLRGDAVTDIELALQAAKTF